MALFEDDEPVLLDCDCWTFPGECYYEVSLPVYNTKTKKFEYKSITYCGEPDCLSKVLEGELDIEEKEVLTATDKEYAYGDERYGE